MDMYIPSMAPKLADMGTYTKNTSSESRPKVCTATRLEKRVVLLVCMMALGGPVVPEVNTSLDTSFGPRRHLLRTSSSQRSSIGSLSRASREMHPSGAAPRATSTCSNCGAPDRSSAIMAG